MVTVTRLWHVFLPLLSFPWVAIRRNWSYILRVKAYQSKQCKKKKKLDFTHPTFMQPVFIHSTLNERLLSTPTEKILESGASPKGKALIKVVFVPSVDGHQASQPPRTDFQHIHSMKQGEHLKSRCISASRQRWTHCKNKCTCISRHPVLPTALQIKLQLTSSLASLLPKPTSPKLSAREGSNTWSCVLDAVSIKVARSKHQHLPRAFALHIRTRQVLLLGQAGWVTAFTTFLSL